MDGGSGFVALRFAEELVIFFEIGCGFIFFLGTRW